MKTKTFSAIVQKEADVWVSLCPELDVASQGQTIEEARANLTEAVELFLETADPDEIQQRNAALHHPTELIASRSF